MNTALRAFLLLPWVWAGFHVAAPAATILLDVDFGTTSSAVQSGFQSFTTGTGNQAAPYSMSYADIDDTLTSGTLTLTLADGDSLTSTGSITARNRTLTGSGTFEYAALYTDVVSAASPVNDMTIGIGGLNANTAYTLTFFLYDNSYTKSETVTDYTSGSAGARQSISWTAGHDFSSDAEDVFAITMAVTSDASGNLVFRGTSSSSGFSINGLEISADAVPEPSSVGMAALGALLLGGVACGKLRHGMWKTA